ncbi:MAG: glycosyltransferase family 2 protein [Ruminiclostridium sp.]|nr:glycosyltransferase family 2 protein [Ruminiclostridium sp.]
MDKPLVSVCTTAYNSEKYLYRFVDSFVNQTFKECELVLVDNHSTDRTYEIMMDYQRRYPDRIRVLKTDEHYNFPAKGRYTAIRNAKADYIYVTDSDDEMTCRAIELLYNAAVNNVYGEADIVCGNAQLIRIDKYSNYTVLPYTHYKDAQLSPNEACTNGVEYWTKLVKKELFFKCGEIPELIFDDASYMTALISHAKRIRTIKEVVYHYFRRDDSLSGRSEIDVNQSSIDAGVYALSHCNKKCIEEVQKMVAVRLYNNFNNRWQYTDCYIEELRGYYPDFVNNEKIKALPRVMPKFNFYMGLSNEPIPFIAYLNGFTRSYSEEELEYYSKTVFAQGCEAIVLNSENCDINENAYIKRLYDEGNYGEVAKYFALKKINETGGVFVDDCIRFEYCLNMCRYFDGFLGMETDDEYNDHVFGAQAGNRLFERVLETYNSNYLMEQNYLLKDRFKLIATSEFGVPSIVKKPIWSNNPVVVLTPNYMTIPGGEKNMCYIDYNPEDEDVVTIKKSMLTDLMSVPAAPASNVQKNLADNYKRELDAIQSSTTYKFASKLMKIGDGPFGPFLKKIFRIFKRK